MLDDVPPARSSATSLLAPVLVVLGLAVLVWTVPRGIDLTDEGLYHLSYAASEPTEFFPSQYDRLVRLLDGPGTRGVVAWRLERLAVEVGVGIGLAAALLRLLRARAPRLRAHIPWPVAGSLTVGFALLGHAWLPGTPSYNSVSAGLLGAAAGLVLLLLAGDGRWSRRDTLSAAALGLVLAVQLFVKWPPALAFGGIAIAAVFAGRGAAAVLRAGVVGAAAAVLVLVLVTDVGVGSLFSVSDLRAVNDVTAGIDLYNPRAIGTRYLEGLARNGRELFTAGGLALTAAVALAFWPHPPWRRRPAAGGASRWVQVVGVLVAVAASAAVLVVAITHLFGEPHFRPTSPLLLLVPVAGLAVAVAAASWLGSRSEPAVLAGGHGSRAVVLAVLVLLVTPVVTSFGTGNELLEHAVTGAAPLGAALAVAAGWVRTRSGPPARVTIAVAVAALVALVLAQAVRGTVRTPYRVPTTLAGQTVGVHSPALAGVRLDPASARFLDELADVVRERTQFRPGDRALALSKAPGLLHALGAEPAGPGWVASPDGDQRPACRALAARRAELDDVEVVLVLDEPVAPALDACLREIWPAWTTLVEVARLPNPFAGVAGYAPELRVLVPPSAVVAAPS